MLEHDANVGLYGPDGKYAGSRHAADRREAQGRAVDRAGDRLRKFDLFASRPEPLVHYRPDWPELETINRLGMLTKQTGMVHRTRAGSSTRPSATSPRRSRWATACTASVVWEQFNHGLNLMYESAKGGGGSSRTAGRTRPRRAYLDFASGLEEYKAASILPVASVLTSIDKEDIGRAGGDIRGCSRSGARSGCGRSRRRDGAGPMKYNTTRRGDQIAASRAS